MEHYNTKQYNRFRKIINENLLEEKLKLQLKILSKNERKKTAYSHGLFPAISGAKNSKRNINRFRKEPAERLWLRVVRQVCLTCYLYTTLKRSSRKIFSKIVFENFGVELKNRFLNFNPSFYKRGKSTTLDLEDIATCRLESRCRTKHQLQHLLLTLVEFPIILNHFTSKERWLLSQHIKYIKLDKRRVITRHDDNSMNVYFLFSGEVHVYVNATKRFDGNTLEEQTKIILNKGSYFGHKKSTSYAICATDCEFFRIPTSLMLKLKLNRGLDLYDNIKFEFFRNWPPISDWSDNAITDLSNQSYLYKKPGKQLILDNEKEQSSDVVWFIVRGSIDIIKITSLERCNKMMKEFNNIVLKTKQKLKIERSNTVVFKPIVSKSRAIEMCSPSSDKNVAPKTFNEKQFGENKDLKNPIYLNIRKLTANQCYGLGKLGVARIQNHLNRFCLSGNDCLYISTPVSKLKALIEVLGVNRDLLRNAEIDLPSDLKFSKVVYDSVIYKARSDKILNEFYAREV